MRNLISDIGGNSLQAKKGVEEVLDRKEREGVVRGEGLLRRDEMEGLVRIANSDLAVRPSSSLPLSSSYLHHGDRVSSSYPHHVDRMGES